MPCDSNSIQPTLRQHVDVFVNSFFVKGARNHIRKTTYDAPWLNVGIMEKTNCEAFYSSTLFSGMNILSGEDYSLGHGFIHGYLSNSANDQIERAVASLNALDVEEIIFYHDESVRGLEMACNLGLKLRFKPVSLLEWLIRKVKDHDGNVHMIDADAAIQLPCSWSEGDEKNALIEELFRLIGVRRVKRTYDFNDRLCCGSRGYFGLATGHTSKDSEQSEIQAHRNIQDAKQAGAKYLVTTCPYCYASLAVATKEAGMIPIQIEGLASMALYREPLPDGLTFL
nr:heterodisulfide reductase-related iron-sulfur binding cluster [uncultured Pseudodesulfovibrio sp.]